MRNLRPMVGGVTLGACLMLGIGIATADGGTAVINACVTKNSTIKVLADGDVCRSSDTPISWNQQGPAGPAGPIGPQGADGVLGLADLSCAAGEAVTGFGADGMPICETVGGGSTRLWFLDADGDGWGDDASTVNAVEQPLGYVSRDGDCNDTEPTVNPDQPEIDGDGIDNDCDGTIDGGSTTLWFLDADGDSWGDDTVVVEAVDQPAGHVARGGDCDDSDPTINPDRLEVDGDGIDNNCDGVFT